MSARTGTKWTEDRRSMNGANGREIGVPARPGTAGGIGQVRRAVPWRLVCSLTGYTPDRGARSQSVGNCARSSSESNHEIFVESIRHRYSAEFRLGVWISSK